MILLGSQSFLELFLLVDVEEYPAEVTRRARIVADHAGPGPDPLTLPGCAPDLEGQVETPAAFRRALDRLQEVVPIARLQDRQKEIVAHLLVRLQAKQPPGHVRPFEFAGLQVEVPGADAESLDADSEMLAPTIVCLMGYAGRRQALLLFSAGRQDAFTAPGMSPKACPEASADVESAGEFPIAGRAGHQRRRI
ncbi:hypothetical protein ABIA45_003279 [Bradyrhizobium sp. USDA 336]